jgi:hypothetical protein
MLDLDAVETRYSRALDAKPGKGEYSPDGIAAIVDSHCDVRDLLAEVRRLRSLPPTEEQIEEAIYNALNTEYGQDAMDYEVESVTAAKAAHRLYPTCQPGREALAEAICRVNDGESYVEDGGPCSACEAAAGAVLASAPGRPESVVQEEALREAADSYPQITRDMVSRGSVARWLRARADRLAGGESRG